MQHCFPIERSQNLGFWILLHFVTWTFLSGCCKRAVITWCIVRRVAELYLQGMVNLLVSKPLLLAL